MQQVLTFRSQQTNSLLIKAKRNLWFMMYILIRVDLLFGLNQTSVLLNIAKMETIISLMEIYGLL